MVGLQYIVEALVKSALKQFTTKQQCNVLIQTETFVLNKL